jgi:hypothetical protein
VGSGIDAGVSASLHQRLKEGPVPAMEIGLRNKQIEGDLLRGDADGFASDLLPYLEGLDFANGLTQAQRDAFSPLAPPRGDLPKLTDDWTTKPIVASGAEDAFLAFAISETLRGIPNVP